MLRQFEQGDVVFKGGGIVAGMFVLVGGDENVWTRGRQIPPVNGANCDSEVGALVCAVGGGEHPVGFDQGAAAQPSVVDANRHLERKLAAHRRRPAHDLLVDNRRAGALI